MLNHFLFFSFFLIFIQSMVVWQQRTTGNTGIHNLWCTALETMVLQLSKWPECFRLCGHKNMINWECDLPLIWFHCSYSLILMFGGHIWTWGDYVWFWITVRASLICSRIFVHKSFISSRPNLHLSFIIFELFHANVRHRVSFFVCVL